MEKSCLSFLEAVGEEGRFKTVYQTKDYFDKTAFVKWQCRRLFVCFSNDNSGRQENRSFQNKSNKTNKIPDYRN